MTTSPYSNTVSTLQALYHLETEGWHDYNEFMSEFMTIQLFLKMDKRILHIQKVFCIPAPATFPGWRTPRRENKNQH